MSGGCTWPSGLGCCVRNWRRSRWTWVGWTAEVVFGQWAEATDGGRLPCGISEPEPVVAGPGVGGMRLVPDCIEGMGVEVLTLEYRRIMEIVAGSDGPVMAKDVAIALRKLADRGWISRTGAGRSI